MDEYKGIKIIWDRDHDQRIFLFIDSLTEEERKNIIIVFESEGCIEITWKNRIIGRFNYLDTFDLYDKNGSFGDSWYIINEIIHIPIERIITKELRYRVLKRQKWICNNCGVQLKYNINSKWDGVIAHIDHIHPFSQRNTYIYGAENINEIENLQALCDKCNLKKGKKND